MALHHVETHGRACHGQCRRACHGQCRMHNCHDIHLMGLSVGAIACGRPDHKSKKLRRQTLHIGKKYDDGFHSLPL